MGVSFALLVSLQHSPRKEAVSWYQMVSCTILTKKKLWALIPRHLIGATQHCTLGNCECSIVLIDESVPEQHDLIPSLGRSPEQKGGVLKTHLAELVNASRNQKWASHILLKNVTNSASASDRCLQTVTAPAFKAH